MRKLPGLTREAEEKRLCETIKIAEDKLESARQDVKALADELHEMLEVFDEKDKEAMTLWRNTDARYAQVNQELRRATQARQKPYFGRIDFTDKKIGKKEAYYIGRSVIAKNPAEPEVIDWRAPVAGVYYDAALGDVQYFVKDEGKCEITLHRKRTYEIEQDRLKDFYDSDVVANDELLTKYLAKNKRAVLGEIIATIQQEQNEVIRKKPQHNMIIQGAAGSGKTTVAMHRISYILYNYELEFAPQDFYIVGSNQVLLNYITGVLPELNVYGVSQMTMEQLFIRLLYEDWDREYTVKPVQKGVTPFVKGTFNWFKDLEAFCERYERSVIPRGDVRIEKNGVLLLDAEAIERILNKSGQLSRADKISRLTEHLQAKLENEISGKYYSYTFEEKRRLRRYYDTYFGKREWKGSIYELYDAFLAQQSEKGFSVEPPCGTFDVYDLAALAYLYKRIKETDIIREAGHVVIDEAQDFGMMVYGALKYCLSKCTYTIMGDVAQNISMDYGLNDWAQLQELMLPDEFDYFGLLRKSYRNTVEIARFATDILYHGSFQVYPIEPIIRHGNDVRVTACSSFEGLLKETYDTVQKWKKDGLETIAVICADRAEAERVTAGLTGKLSLLPAKPENMEFGAGVMVLPLELTKGLEFDAVLIFDASETNYPAEDGYVKRLYVAATRALHELTVLYQKNLTKLIAEPAPKEARLRAAVQVKKPARKPMPEEPERTKTEKRMQKAAEAAIEMQDREKYGPRRIVAEGKTDNSTGNMTENVDIKNANIKNVTIKRNAAASVTGPETGKPPKHFADEFGEVPDNSALRPAGHAKIDCAVRLAMKGNGYYDILSSYGTLRITPMSPEIIRICFARGQRSKFPLPVSEITPQNVRCKVRETAGTMDISTDKLTVRVDKKTGALSFMTNSGKVLLGERMKEPRQIEQDRNRVFFDWKKEEKLIARGLENTDKPFLEIGSLAKYISYGKDCEQMPGLASSYGYELLFPPCGKILCCNIPMYGTYVSVEQSEIIDYYFRVVRA